MMRGSSSCRWICVWFLHFPVSFLLALAANKPIPITVLSGFLGSGKTTLLQNLLQNNQGLRIAVVVNDVAAVNIDSKLISSPSSSSDTARPAGIVELQNGCACCSKSEELLASVSELVTLSDLRAGDDACFQHIVVEMSGVADPKSVRAKFQEAVLYDMPLMERVQLDTMVTLVDCTSFLQNLQSAKQARPDETPELFYRDGQEAPSPIDENESEMVPSGLLAALGGGSPDYYAAEQAGGVAELLISQTETADLVLLNKVDLVANDEATTRQIEDIVRAINPRAQVVRTEFGAIELHKVLGVAQGKGVVEAGIVDDHKESIAASSSSTSDVVCDDPDCTDPSHSHAHSHNHGCDDPDCTDPSHSHSHSHDHDCDDPDCTDPSHDHSHDDTVTSTAHAGIGTFVYRARRPFHPGRLATFLRHLPIARGLPDNDEPSNGSDSDVENEAGPETRQTLQRIIRSKGFTWCADSHAAALYWSQSGPNFDLSVLGSWWATLDRSQWPAEAVDSILQDFDNVNHSPEDEKTCASVGDRRQEIVFIGPTMGARKNQDLVHTALDQCLLNDDEWNDYIEKQSSPPELANRFENPFNARAMSF